jgi:hypothetical protein
VSSVTFFSILILEILAAKKIVLKMYPAKTPLNKSLGAILYWKVQISSKRVYWNFEELIDIQTVVWLTLQLLLFLHILIIIKQTFEWGVYMMIKEVCEVIAVHEDVVERVQKELPDMSAAVGIFKALADETW